MIASFKLAGITRGELVWALDCAQAVLSKRRQQLLLSGNQLILNEVDELDRAQNIINKLANELERRDPDR